MNSKANIQEEFLGQLHRERHSAAVYTTIVRAEPDKP